MEINSNSQPPYVVPESLTKRTQLSVPPDNQVSGVQKDSVIPSTIVTISDHAQEILKQAAQESTPYTYVEKTDKEYESMSFQDLIDERNGGKNGIPSLGPGTTRGALMNGKAATAAMAILDKQHIENVFSAREIGVSLNAFKKEMVKKFPELKNKTFDVSFSNGKAIISGDGLPKKLKDDLQNELENTKNTNAVKLQSSISKFNSIGLDLVNMRIYEEKGMYGGADSIYVHRNDPLTMKEFTDKISYSSVAQSDGGYTYTKHSEVIGSTGYGAVHVYKSSTKK